MTSEERIEKALAIAQTHGSTDGAHSKMWVIDQMVRALTGCPMETHSAVDYQEQPYTYTAQGESDEYRAWAQATCAGEHGPDTYTWDTGMAP